MATASLAPSHAFLAAFLPVARASLFPTTATPSAITRRVPLAHRLQSILPAAFIPIPQLIDTIWEGILKAVPKKKTSYSRKRSRFLVGKDLKDVTSLNKCSSCGRTKRAHVLCPYCVRDVQKWFSGTISNVKAAFEAQKRECWKHLEEKNDQLHLMKRKTLAERRAADSRRQQKSTVPSQKQAAARP